MTGILRGHLENHKFSESFESRQKIKNRPSDGGRHNLNASNADREIDSAGFLTIRAPHFSTSFGTKWMTFALNFDSLFCSFGEIFVRLTTAGCTSQWGGGRKMKGNTGC